MRKHIQFVAYRKVYNWTIKYVVLLFMCALFGVCSVYIYFFYSSSTINDDLIEPIHVSRQVENVTFSGKKYVHLDLKGSPPKIEYFEYLFPLLAKNGVAGIVIEYEDTFPFKGILANVSALNAYTRNEIEVINMLADKNRLDIIPLVQTFGHLEYVLKLREFEELREVPLFPQVLCPSNYKSLHLITELITQIVEAHPYLTTIHIGVDEVHYLGRCKECTKRMKRENITTDGLYLKHIQKVRELIWQKYPLLKILMWDDMLRNYVEDDTSKGLETLEITPVVRQYEADVFNALGPSLWGQYSKVFKKVWIASAYKGATGVDQYLVDVPHYNQNHRSWLEVIENYKHMLNFEAIILTGWQRYDHFSILCELLPVGLPSLLMNLKILNGEGDSRFGPTKEVAQILHCQQPYALMGPSFGSPQCSFPGSDILENVYRLHQIEGDFRELKRSPMIRGWMSYFNQYYRFSSPEKIYSIGPQLSHLGREMEEIERDMTKALLEVYDEYTKDEWILTYLSPLKKEINGLLEMKEELLKSKVWPRRPLKHEGSS